MSGAGVGGGGAVSVRDRTTSRQRGGGEGGSRCNSIRASVRRRGEHAPHILSPAGASLSTGSNALPSLHPKSQQFTGQAPGSERGWGEACRSQPCPFPVRGGACSCCTESRPQHRVPSLCPPAPLRGNELPLAPHRAFSSPCSWWEGEGRRWLLAPPPTPTPSHKSRSGSWQGPVYALLSANATISKSEDYCFI